MKESHIQKAILDYLKLKGILCFKHRNVGIYKKDTGKYIPLAYGEKGIADILGCTPDGRFIACEVKVPGKKPSPDQVVFLDKVKKQGGIAILAYSLDDVMKVIS
mgnify:CR=1 FL=1